MRCNCKLFSCSAIYGLYEEYCNSITQIAILQRKLEEGGEVVGAVSAQLVDYKQIVVVLTGQLRRGKPATKSTTVEA